MKVASYDNQLILHCANCGCTFFEGNGINRISEESAFKLSQDKQNDDISGQEKKCPKDKTMLTVKTSEESIPQDVTLLQCPKCKGIFAFPDDLLHFKKAQDTKLAYFKTWGIPLPSLRAVVVLSFVALVSATIFARFMLYDQGSLGSSQAQNLIKKIAFSKSGRYLFVYFNSSLPTASYILFKNTKTGEILNKPISKKPTTIHYATISDLTLTDSFSYQIVLVDQKGKKVRTEEKTLEIR